MPPTAPYLAQLLLLGLKPQVNLLGHDLAQIKLVLRNLVLGTLVVRAGVRVAAVHESGQLLPGGGGAPRINSKAE
jgi:hypothetical protein